MKENGYQFLMLKISMDGFQSNWLHKSGENPLNLFHVENGILEVDYGKFDKV